MKKLIILPLLILCGCANISSFTDESTDPKTGNVSKHTSTWAFTFFDAHSQLTKFSTRIATNQTNSYNGTTVADLNQESSGSNVLNTANHLIDAVAPALKSAP